MSLAEGRFWQRRDSYHNLVEEFERNISVTHPNFVSCNVFSNLRCSYCARDVVNYEEPSINTFK